MNKRQKKRSNRKGNKREQGVDHSIVLTVPRHLGWAAPRYRCTLRFHTMRVLNNVGTIAANLRYVPTFAYDVDPTLASTAMPGFTELGSLYRFYRVQKATINVKYSNLEAFPVECYTCPVNADPGANYSSTQAQTYLSQKTSKSCELGPLTGNGIGRITDTQLTSRFGGSANVNNADFYTGATGGGAPNNNWYWTVGIVATSNFVSGVTLRVVIDVDLEFFEVQSPSS